MYAWQKIKAHKKYRGSVYMHCKKLMMKLSLVYAQRKDRQF